MARFTLHCSDGTEIPYAELGTDTQKMSYIGKRFRAQRVFSEISSSLAYKFAANMIGFSTIETVGGVQFVTRTLPKPYPVRSVRYDTFFLYARELLDIEHFRPSGGTRRDSIVEYGVYDQARVKIGYETLTYNLRTDQQVLGEGGGPDDSLLLRYITRHLLPSGEYFQLPRGAHRWTSDGAQHMGSLGRALNRADLAYTWHEVPGIPTNVYEAVGCLNALEFDGFAASKLYLVACEAIPYKSMAGNTVYDITYRMRWCGEEQPSHNHFLRFKNGLETVWDVPVSSLAGAPRKVFQLHEFSRIFRGPFGFTR